MTIFNILGVAFTAGGGGGGGGGGSGGDPANTLNVTNLGAHSYVVVDTSGVWTSQGGDVPEDGSVTLQVLGDSGTVWHELSEINATWGQPSVSTPIVAYPCPAAKSVTFRLGASHVGRIDVVHYLWPWKAGADAYDQAGAGNNPTYFGGAYPHDATVFPTAANGFQAYAAKNSQILNVPWALQTIPGSKAVYCTVIPGDQPFTFGGNVTNDNRVEINGINNDARVDTPAATAGGGLDDWSFGVDFLSQYRMGFVVVRWDYLIPTTYDTGVTLRNDTYTDWVAQLHARTDSQGHPTPQKAYPADIAGAPDPPGSVVTFAAAQLSLLSNLMEDQGPATMTWASAVTSPPGSAPNGQLRYKYTPESAGIDSRTLFADTINVDLDTRYRTFMEMQQAMFPTVDGQPYIITSQPGYSAGNVLAQKELCRQRNLNQWAVGTTYAANAQVFGSDYKVYKSLAGNNVGNDPTTDGGAHWTPFWTPFIPYGHPRDSNGDLIASNRIAGAGWRAWRQISNLWVCTTQNLLDASGNALSVPGTVKLDIVNGKQTVVTGDSDLGFGTLAGWISGPMMKVGAGQVVADTGSHITITNNISTDGGQPPGWLWCDGEYVRFTAFSGGNFTTPRRGERGTTTATHAAGTWIYWMTEPNELSPGINRAQGATGPLTIKDWPAIHGPTVNSILLSDADFA